MTKYLTNQQLLQELAKRLPDFTPDEFAVLLGWTVQYQSEIMKLIQAKNPQIYGWIKEKHQQLEQQKTDKDTEQLKKLLDQK